MKRSNVLVLLSVVLACRFTYAASENIAVPTEEQVQKLAAAAWKEPIKSIDVTFYKDYTTVPTPVDKIHKKMEQFFDEELGNRSPNELNSYEIENRNKNIELNVKNWVENQKYPRKAKERVRISDDERRCDFVIVGPNEPLGPDTPFVHTFVTTKDANTGEFISYHYASEMNTVFIETKQLLGENIERFARMPYATALFLRILLGTYQDSNPESINYIPDPNKMAELVRTGLTKIVPRETKYAGNTTVYRIGIHPDPNSPETKDIVEIRDINHFQIAVLICDRNDYSQIYRAEIYFPPTNKIIYFRECGNFDSNGFPHNIIEIKYDKDGNLIKKSVYRIIKIELNPLLPTDVFKFHRPDNYKVMDNRTQKP